jgi:hypothetical protein
MEMMACMKYIIIFSVFHIFILSQKKRRSFPVAPTRCTGYQKKESKHHHHHNRIKPEISTQRAMPVALSLSTLAAKCLYTSL